MKDGKTESYGTIIMDSIVNRIRNILREEAESIATKEFNRDSEVLEDEIKTSGLKADNKKSKKKASQDEDEDIVSKSKKDLEIKDDSDKEDSEDKKVKTGDESPSTINLADASSYEKLTDILNQFRAARSFTDEEVAGRLKDYFDSLTREEKEILHVFIKGLVQITVLDVDGKDAYTPDKLMYKIRKTGSVSSEKNKSLKRRIDKAKDKDADIEASKDVNVPIKIGEAFSSKKSLLDIVRRNNM